MTEADLLDTNQTAKRTKLSPSRLAKARITGDGPPFVKLGHSVRYRPADVDRWIAARIRCSTSEPAEAAV